MEVIYIGEASKLLGISTVTFNKWVKLGYIKHHGISGKRFRFFNRKDVLKLKSRIVKNRKKGLPLLVL